jgi:hypothetical protein
MKFRAQSSSGKYFGWTSGREHFPAPTSFNFQAGAVHAIVNLKWTSVSQHFVTPTELGCNALQDE